MGHAVVVGVGEITQREVGLEPADLMAEAARRAGADSGGSLLGTIDLVAAVNILAWPHPDPGRVVAERLGIPGVRTVQSTISGTSPHVLLHRAAAEIAAGRLGTALVVGAEALHSRRRLTDRGAGWVPPAGEPAAFAGDDRPGSSAEETAHQAAIPTQVYPLFETALRASAGRTIADHQAHLGRLWSRFAAVAATHPAAWSRAPFAPEEISEPGPGNRMVTFPYTKRMCANIDVDQAAALLVCSPEMARDAGVPGDRVVHLHAGAEASDHHFFTERESLCESPAMAAVGRRLLAAAGLSVDDIARFDLYSCFPSAVELALGALGLAADDSRPLTVTGGLPFFGGPGSNYVSHSVAAMVRACREDPGSFGMVTGIGWFATKHSAGIYSTQPPERGFARVDPAVTQAEVDATPRREPAGPYTGPATVEATAVRFGRDGTPALAVVSALTPDGRRALANTADAALLASMTTEEWSGRGVEVRSDGCANTLG